MKDLLIRITMFVVLGSLTAGMIAVTNPKEALAVFMAYALGGLVWGTICSPIEVKKNEHAH